MSLCALAPGASRSRGGWSAGGGSARAVMAKVWCWLSCSFGEGRAAIEQATSPALRTTSMLPECDIPL